MSFIEGSTAEFTGRDVHLLMDEISRPSPLFLYDFLSYLLIITDIFGLLTSLLKMNRYRLLYIETLS